MIIKPGNPEQLADIQSYLTDLRHSRFDVTIEEYRGAIRVKNIRLKESKHYCGNHPNACELNDGPGRRGKFLEGLDWVEFNDRINDILDLYDVDANVQTMLCKLRKSKLRRTHYGSYETGDPRQPWQWNMDEPQEHWQNYCKQVAPNSTYPEGTPGIYSREVCNV